MGLALIAIWLCVAYGFRFASLASLAAAVVFPVGMFYVFGNTPTAWIAVLISALLFWRHRDNIRKLVAGRESTIGR